jgi:hypothetical protein
VKNRLILLLLCALIVPGARAATDPLGATFAPSIDTNCSDPQYAANIWLSDWRTKLRQDSGTPASNACYLTIYGTQNEFVDFQVHLHDTGSGTANMSVTVSNFVQSSPGSFTISAATTPPPNIIVYREQYMDVTIKTATGATFFNSTGYYPDILIPAVDPYWGQTTNAWPYTVSAGNNQSAWVDVLIPSGAPAGYYLASVTVKSGSTTLATMPVILAVWQWPNAGYMPSTPTLKTEESGWGYNGLCTQMYSPNATTGTTGCGAYPGAGGGNDGGVTMTWLDADMLMKDHRYSSGGGENVFPGSGSFSNYVTLVGPILNGTCNLHGGGGSVCPILPGSKNTTKQLFDLSVTSPIWSNWQANYDSHAWGAAGQLPLYDYLCDEPYPSGGGTCGASTSAMAMPTLVANAATRHGYLTPGVPELVTTSIWWGQANQTAANSFSTTTCGSATCIQNSIDIMVVPINVLDPVGGMIQPLSAYTSWLSGSTDSIPRQWWSYEACGSAGTCSNGTVGPSNFTYPNNEIDGVPAANRAFEWITFLHGQTGELYYAADICMVPTSQGQYCGYPSHTYDPWQSVYYSGNWGDGTMVYAGSLTPTADNYMGAGVKIPLILPSLRLKLIRDGIQDYEYLNVLNNSGNNSFVQTQIASWVKNSYTFETTGSGLQSARLALGNFMHALTFGSSGSPAPPTGVKVITVQ